MTLVHEVLERIVHHKDINPGLLVGKRVYHQRKLGRLVEEYQCIAMIEYDTGESEEIIINHAELHPTTFVRADQGEEKMVKAYKIFSGVAQKVVMGRQVTEFSIVRDDHKLEQLLSAHRSSIKSEQDLLLFTNALHRQFPLLQTADWALDDKISLGIVLNSKHYASRHVAGLAYGLLLLSGKQPHFMRTSRGTERHAFLKAVIDDGDYLIDPINDWVFPFAERVYQIESLGKTSAYHEHCEEIPIRTLFE